MRFRFGLQAVLDQTIALEAIERARLAEARAAANIAAERVASVGAELAERRAARNSAAPGTAAELAAFDAASIALGALLAQADTDRTALAAAYERARCRYVEVAARRMGLERLRERRHAAYLRARDLVDAADVDEANLARGRECARNDENGRPMIELHRRGGQAIVVNAELIETVESSAAGETVVTLTTGNALAITETPDDVRRATIAYRREISGQQR